MEVTGEHGNLVVEGGAMRGFQSGRLKLSLAGKPHLVDEGEVAAMAAEAANVAAMYAALRNDIISGTSAAPDFEHAVRLEKLIDDVPFIRAKWNTREGQGLAGIVSRESAAQAAVGSTRSSAALSRHWRRLLQRGAAAKWTSQQRTPARHDAARNSGNVLLPA
jgi:hypothetical protein